MNRDTLNQGTFVTFDGLKNRTSKVFKIALYLLQGVLILVLILSILFSIPAIQTKVASLMAARLGKQLQTEVSIGRVALGYTGKLHFEDVLIRDQQNDTLFYIHDLRARISHINRNKMKVVLQNVSLDGALVNFVTPSNSTIANFQFFVDFFAVPAGQGGGVWTIIFKKLKLENSSFRFLNRGFDAPTDRDFDENNFAFNQINGDFKDFMVIGDSLDFKVKQLSAVEKNGLRLKRMACKAKIHNNGMEYTDLLLETDRSRLQDQLTFTYRGYPRLTYFIDSVYMTARLDESLINVNDLAYFAHNLNPYILNNIKISGEAKGYVRRLKVRNFDMRTGKNTLLKGNVDITGLPDWQSSFTDLDLSEFRTDMADIGRILNLQDIPENLYKFEDAVFAGHLTGFYSDFAADGVLASSLGLLRSRINFKIDELDHASYSGELIAEDFDVGQLFDQKNLGKTSFTFDLKKGSGLSLTDLQSEFSSEVDYVDFNGYRLKNISAEGLYRDKSFDGEAAMNDENARFSFVGKMDFNADVPTYNFESDIEHLDLKAIHLDSIQTTLSAKLDINLTGSEMDNLDGKARVSNLKIMRGKYAVNMAAIQLESGFDQHGRHVELRSDVVDASITGNYNFSYLDEVYADILNTLFPDYYTARSKLPGKVNIDAQINIRENKILGHFLQQELTLGSGMFSMNYNSELKSLEVDGEMDHLYWDNLRFENYYLNMRKKPFQLLNLSTEIDEMYANNSLLTHSILLNASILPNDVDFLFNFADSSDHLALRSYGMLHFSKNVIDLKLTESTIFSGGKAWKVDEENHLVFQQGAINIEQLKIFNGIEQVIFTGAISDRDHDRILVEADHLDLSNFNDYLSEFNVSTGGLANGEVSIYRVLDEPFIHANLDVLQLAYGGDTLGNLHVETRSTDNPLLMEITARIEEGLLKDIVCEGSLDLRGAKPRFDLQLEVRNANVKPFEVFFAGIASNFEGTINAKGRLKGTRDLHTLKGKISAQGVGFDVDYLRTRYFINDEIMLNDANIDFKTVRVKDIYGNSGLLKGSIKHDLFSEFELDLKLINVNKMLCLNTTKEDNSLFYGKALASGTASFKGPLNNIEVDIAATSEKGTHITIPIYTESDNAIMDYIRFKAPIDTMQKAVITNRKERVDGLVVKMAFTVTEDAEFELLFDEILDDRITGSGTGNISMEYTSYEDFYMYGDFRISKGIYPFSSPTLVSEKFDLREGGRIVWNGDPYNANIDLQASVARNRANPRDLMVGYLGPGDEASYNTNIKMNVILNLKGDLFSPDITFGMEFPDNIYSSGLTQFNSLIKRVETDPDELNRQVFSLLTFGSFTPIAGFSLGTASPTGNDLPNIVSSSIGSFLSNQVNNWISEYQQNWELGVDYKTRTGITDEEKAELILSARRKLFNERMELAGSYNAYSTGSINPYNVDLVYNMKKDGSLKLKAYHKLANDPTLGQVSNVTTTGVGFYFKKQFGKLNLLRSKEPEPTK